MPLTKSYPLPKPPRLSSVDWQPVIRVGRSIPFGYEQDEDDPDLLLPIVDELDALELAKDLLKEYSSRNVAAWLSDVTGREISHTGLISRIKREQTRRQKASIYKFYKRKAEEAARKAKALEGRLGSKEARREASS